MSKPEELRNSEDEPVKRIEDAENFDELYDILDRMGDIMGNGGVVYKSEYLKQEITKIRGINVLYPAMDGIVDPLEQLRKLAKQLQLLTRSEGLRDKVSEILYREIQIGNELLQEFFRNNKKK